ncbi:MAG TPA: NADH-quinone oxidoreductase subunit NuoE [bacterium]|nr:NADH-quinone oxidoreductase subunit NuoE [bacterium]
MALSASALAEIRRLMARFPHRQSALLGALFVAQDEAGALSPEVVAEVAAALELPASEVASVASFYHLYRFKPQGRHLIQVCTNISCLLNGCDRIVEHLSRRLGIAVGETTPDGRFTLRTAECLAACDAAPVMMVGPDRHGPLTPEQIEAILEAYA